MAAYDEMERKVNQVDEVVAERENYRQICKSMYDEGIIKQDDQGTFVAVEDPLERESIKSKSKMKMTR